MHHPGQPPPRLLLVAHGTASVDGASTTRRLVDALAADLADVDVQLCFLDVDAPRLPDALTALDDRPTVLVPLLLSTGYHVQTDIPAAVAGYGHVRVARHLGPHPLLVDALADRLPAGSYASTLLVGAGSSRDEAADELARTAAGLAQRLGAPVATATMADDLTTLFATSPAPVRVATYLLAPGRFVDTVRAQAAHAGQSVAVADPIGGHPALVELVVLRYEAARGDR